MAKNDNKQDTKYGAPADSLASDAYPAITTEPDAKFYAIQDTSEPLDPAMGDVPAGRFQEQVLKTDASSGAEDNHPVENRPPTVSGDGESDQG